MRTIILSCLAIISLGLAFTECGPRNPSLSQLILGKWNIDGMQAKDDKTKPLINGDGWIKFHTDNTFDAEGEPHGIIDGAWQIDEESEVISLEVNQNLSDKSKWEISIEDKKMEWSNQTINVNLELTKP